VDGRGSVTFTAYLVEEYRFYLSGLSEARINGVRINDVLLYLGMKIRNGTEVHEDNKNGLNSRNEPYSSTQIIYLISLFCQEIKNK
jgi:hypothetical protein